MNHNKPQGINDNNADKASEILQHLLTDMADLSLQLKQAHWNVVGPTFRSVHLELDEIVAIVKEELDEVAERINTLGGVSRNDARYIIEHSTLDAYPVGRVKDIDVVEIISARIQKLIEHARDHLEQLAEVDAVSEDIVIGSLGRIEKADWMLRAQLQKATV